MYTHQKRCDEIEVKCIFITKIQGTRKDLERSGVLKGRGSSYLNAQFLALLITFRDDCNHNYQRTKQNTCQVSLLQR